jgi:glycosyltransferase involved in cell wall biosynthesis
MRRHLTRLLSRLPEEGIRLSLAAPQEDLAAWERLGDLPRYAVPISDRPHPRRDLEAIRALRSLLAETRPNVIHAHGYRAGWIAALAARWTQGTFPSPAAVSVHEALLVTAHNLFPTRPSLPAALALQQVSRRAARWIAITEAVRESLERARIPGSRIAVIPNGIDADALKPTPRGTVRAAHGVPAEAPMVAVVARLEPAKGVEDAVRAFAMLRRAHPLARMVVAGEGPDRAALEELSHSLSLRESVRFLGWRDDAADVLAASDACLIPSRSEGQSLVALEAMALGVPVVASSVGGLPEMIRHEATGLLAPPGNPPAMARQLSRLFRDPLLGAHLTREAHREVREAWSEDRMIRQTADLYRSLAIRK